MTSLPHDVSNPSATSNAMGIKHYAIKILKVMLFVLSDGHGIILNILRHIAKDFFSKIKKKLQICYPLMGHLSGEAKHKDITNY